MKKRLLFLATFLLLALVFLPGVLATEEEPSLDLFSVETTDGLNYNGYLVGVVEGARPRISLKSVGLDPVVDNLFLAESIDEIRQTLREDQILFIEPNYLVTLWPDSSMTASTASVSPLSVTPNDPLFPRQWALQQMNARALWERGLGGAGVRLGIIDSGITSHHVDIDRRWIAEGFNFVTNDTNVNDTIGHGTQIAGLIIATRNNGLGMAGLLDQVSLVPLRVFEGDSAYLAPIILAIRSAVDDFNVDVINMSFGLASETPNQALRDAINHADSQGVILVAAAGNYGHIEGRGTLTVYPASFPNVVNVAALNEYGNAAYFSQRNNTLTITAPGVNLVTISHQHPSGYYFDPGVRGTSFSAPYVAALAAAARVVNPYMTTSEFMEVLRQSAVHQGPGTETMYGYGVLDINRFLVALPGTVWFHDISGHWAVNSILRVADQDLFGGVGGGAFAPNQTMDRAMFVTVLGRLYRLTGGYIPGQNATFADTTNDTWYSSYVAWAAEQGIVAGFPGNRFQPTAPVSREQAATFLSRFSSHIGRYAAGDTARLADFIDGNYVAPWAKEAIAWAIEAGIITGISIQDGTALRPGYNSTRAQVAVILHRFMDYAGLHTAAAA